MTTADHPLPSVLDAREWQYQAQTIAHAAVRLAQDMALDYGKELKIHRKPAVELRYEPGAGFSRGPEPPVLFWARHTANQALSMEGVISRLLTQSAAAPDPDESARIRQMLAELPPPLTMPLVKDPDPASQPLIPDADLQPQEQQEP